MYIQCCWAPLAPGMYIGSRISSGQELEPGMSLSVSSVGLSARLWEGREKVARWALPVFA